MNTTNMNENSDTMNENSDTNSDTMNENEKSTTILRIAHSRFKKMLPVRKNDNSYDRVVTSVWTFNPETHILTYSATKFQKVTCTDHWNKNAHLKRALERFHSCPRRIHLKSASPLEMSNAAMDWFISKKLIYVFGTHNKEATPDVRRIHFEKIIKSDFNIKYDPFYKPENYKMMGCGSGNGNWIYSDVESDDPIYNPFNAFFIMLGTAFTIVSTYYVYMAK